MTKKVLVVEDDKDFLRIMTVWKQKSLDAGADEFVEKHLGREMIMAAVLRLLYCQNPAATATSVSTAN